MSLACVEVHFQGLVQGVGFRPTLHRMADELGLKGWIQNTGEGVSGEVEGHRDQVEQWLTDVSTKIPKPAQILAVKKKFVEPRGYQELTIRTSSTQMNKSTFVPADIVLCPQCRSDILSETNRRFAYPFTTCTQCGPRFSLIENLPFDRAVTSMIDFTMCPTCLREYRDSKDRRFHSQTNCCPECGPVVEFYSLQEQVNSKGDSVWQPAQQALRDGKIIALKGMGGFQLLCNAFNDRAVSRLRSRKKREAKPFAVMFSDLEQIKKHCFVSDAEKMLLESQEGPIVLLKKREIVQGPAVSDLVAPGCPRLGAFLPTTGLHLLLLNGIDFPIIATSGNISDEPICIENTEAELRLGQIADYFLTHNRRLLRAVDDSVLQVVMNEPQIIRRARGFAPLPLPSVERASNSALLALGSQFKSTVALGLGPQVFIGQHNGDLDNEKAFEGFKRSCVDFQKIYSAETAQVICDLHSDYQSSRFAHEICEVPFEVQHHLAHALSCLSENIVTLPALAVCWDGTGMGLDGTIWGGEFLAIERAGFQRFAHLRPFPLPGGDQASREPNRSLAGLNYEMGHHGSVSQTYLEMLKNNFNSPRTSSMGRLFDAVAVLLGFEMKMRFEGEAAVFVQNLAERIESTESYRWRVEGGVIDWQPMLEEMLRDLDLRLTRELVSRKFHNSLADLTVMVSQSSGLDRVALTGGCFQNSLLSELCITRLRKSGFKVYWHHQVPPNDGGISYGQIEAYRLFNKGEDRHVPIRPC